MFTTNLYKYHITSTNSQEYHILKNEIFNNRIYDFPIQSSTPKILDVGAHVGLATLFFKREFPDSQITAFEPNPKLFSILEENIFVNKIEGVTLLNIGVDSTPGEKDFHTDPTEDAWLSTGGLKHGGWNANTLTSPIKIVTAPLSKYIETEFDILKLDIEGNELNVLNEVSSKLSLIKNIAVEYHPGTNFTKLERLLKTSGFKLNYIQDGKPVLNPDTKKLLVIRGTR